MIYLGCDHRGYELKESLKAWLLEQGEEVEDVGAFGFDPDDDYFDYGVKVAESIEGNGGTSRGILFCGSGHGMEMVANRFPRVRAILGFSEEVTIQGRQDEDANILVIPADWTSEEAVRERVRMFLETEFSKASRHIRRIGKLESIRISNKE
ncbi:MAG: RpiB/LacA/LacB family sugar-phosphate isomerase [bacterium]